MSVQKGLGLYHNLDLANQENEDEIKSIYQKWADTYDTDNDDSLGTVSQPNCVALLSQYQKDKSGLILDVGCGTGQVGKYLTSAGFHHFDGTDISPDMLEKAKNRGYRDLFVSNLNDILPVTDQSYDVCLCVGVFTHGHVTADGLDELIRITKQGGFLCFTVNEGVYDAYGFEAKMADFTKAKKWDIKAFQKDEYMTKKQVQGYYCLAQIL